MLVLSRKRGESIVIGGSIVVTVVEVRGDKVRLGIEAPKDVTVYRSEIQEEINAGHSGKVSDKDMSGEDQPSSASKGALHEVPERGEEDGRVR